MNDQKSLAIKELARRELQRRQTAPVPIPQQSGNSIQIAGPIGRGVESVQKGLSPQDAPSIVGKSVNAGLAGAPQFLANRPFTGPMQAFSPSYDVMPKAATPEGEKLGNEMAMIASFLPAIEGLQSIVAPAARSGAKATANRLMNSVLKPTIKDLQKNPQLGYEAAKAGFSGTKQQIAEKAEKLLVKSEDKLQTILDKSRGTVDATKVANVLDDVKAPFANTGDSNAVSVIEEIQKVLKEKGTLTLKEANKLKRDFYSTLRDTNYGTAEVGPKIAGKKAAARGLREGIEKAAPDQPIAQLNKEMGLAGKTRDLAERAQNAGQRNSLGGLVDMGFLGGGIGTGNPGFYAAALARKAAGSSYVKSKLAELLTKIA